jgi:hypothetical protein
MGVGRERARCHLGTEFTCRTTLEVIPRSVCNLTGVSISISIDLNKFISTSYKELSLPLLHLRMLLQYSVTLQP